ncbi:HSP20-like chaperones superfamily protein [Actinidia rufa]|uniref:HSP20-like chaperones superfamily protein n=1 Tax=Actinidia rufa TaxID=165716 RepID=A0A7J0DQL9_9ERIC|nr:HSP20-like chaperones superfamily protein [Actinidia rufa]
MLSDADYALGKPRMRNEMNRKTIGQIRQCIGHEHDETSAHGFVDQVEGDVPGEDISEQSLNEEACVEASERDYSGETNERVLESHRKRSKEEAREEVSRRRSRRSREEHARDLYGWRTTQRRVVSKGTVRFRMADGRSMKEILQEKEDWRAIPTRGSVQTRGDVVQHRPSGTSEKNGRGKQPLHRGTQSKRKDIRRMYLKDPEWYRSARRCFGIRAKVWPDTKSCAHKGGEMESRRLAKRRTLQQRTPVGGAGHLSDKVQALRFRSAFTSMEVKLPVEEGNVSQILSCRSYRGAGSEVVRMDNLKNSKVARERRKAEQDVILGGLLGAHSLLLCAKGLGECTDSRERSAEVLGHNSIFDPLSANVWDPFRDFPFPQIYRENSAIVNARVDQKETPEAHMFKADVPGLRKEEVKVEIEDDRVLQISGKRNVEKEEKSDTWHRVERSSGELCGGSGFRRMRRWMESGLRWRTEFSR